jgi:Ion channel
MESSLPLERHASHRYGIVLGIALVAVVFLIVAPESEWSRSVGILLAGGMLFVVVVTSRGGDRELRRGVASAITIATVAVALATGLGWIAEWIGAVTGMVLVISTLVQLVRGLARLLQHSGVTIQAVAGALAVYLLLGIVFAFAIGVLAKAGHGWYFAEGTDGTESQRVYFSFTSMTTTGFGDLTPAQRGGRALAVLEMLLGQIYLVTVISLLVGNLRRRSAADEPGDGA